MAMVWMLLSSAYKVLLFVSFVGILFRKKIHIIIDINCFALSDIRQPFVLFVRIVVDWKEKIWPPEVGSLVICLMLPSCI